MRVIRDAVRMRTVCEARSGRVAKWAFSCKFSLASWLSLAHCAAERATMDLRSGHTVLEEDYDETYEPTEEGEAG